MQLAGLNSTRYCRHCVRLQVWQWDSLKVSRQHYYSRLACAVILAVFPAADVASTPAASFDVIPDVISHVVNTFSVLVKFLDRHFTDFRDVCPVYAKVMITQLMRWLLKADVHQFTSHRIRFITVFCRDLQRVKTKVRWDDEWLGARWILSLSSMAGWTDNARRDVIIWWALRATAREWKPPQLLLLRGIDAVSGRSNLTLIFRSPIAPVLFAFTSSHGGDKQLNFNKFNG